MNTDRKVRRNFLTFSLRNKNKKFSFFSVKLQFTERHSLLHILKVVVVPVTGALLIEKNEIQYFVCLLVCRKTEKIFAWRT